MGHEIKPLQAKGMDVSGVAAVHYLLPLAASGRRTMDRALRTIGSIILGRDVQVATDVPWGQIRYEHASALRAVLVMRYSPATVNKHLSALRGVMRAAWRLDEVDGDTLSRIVDIPNVKGTAEPAGRMLSLEELKALWTAADEMGPRHGALLALLFACGLRRSEAASVTPSAIECTTDELGVLTVWIMVHGKGGKMRRVALRNGAAARVRDLALSMDAPYAHLLGLNTGRSVAKMLARIVRRAGGAHCSPHDLRRSFVSHALAAGSPIADVARVAGHADPRTTARYDRRPDEALVGVADALESQ